MATTYEKLKIYLQSIRWNFKSYDEQQTVGFTLAGKHANFPSIVTINADDDVIQLKAYFPSNAVEKIRPAVAEFVCRANDNILLGKFEFSLDDGQIRFQIVAPFVTGALPDQIVSRILVLSAVMTDRYYPGFMRVMFADAKPQDALAAIEAALPEDAAEV